MLVVSDAPPLNILSRATLAGVLPPFLERVFIPPAVAAELGHPSSPAVLRAVMGALPDWLEVRAPVGLVGDEPKGRGEREAITLAVEVHAGLFLADDKAARRTARSLGIATTGTLGVLELAASRGLCDLQSSLELVRSAGLFLSARLIEHSLRQDAERRRIQ